jgi:hypothetical protein
LGRAEVTTRFMRLTLPTDGVAQFCSPAVEPSQTHGSPPPSPASIPSAVDPHTARLCLGRWQAGWELPAHADYSPALANGAPSISEPERPPPEARGDGPELAAQGDTPALGDPAEAAVAGVVQLAAETPFRVKAVAERVRHLYGAVCLHGSECGGAEPWQGWKTAAGVGQVERP